MSDKLEELEKALGRKITRPEDRKIPGTESPLLQETVYLSDDEKSTFWKIFDRLTDFIDPPIVKRGGMVEAGCRITPPEGPQFHGVSYHGDFEGWRKTVEAGAEGLGLLLARIEGDQFVISDGRSVSLSDCEVDLY